jgi:hypothetical protein
VPAPIRLRHVVEHIAVVSALSCSINLAKCPEKQNRDEIEDHFKKPMRTTGDTGGRIPNMGN